MASIGSYEAKTHLPSLLERVAAGERITITKRGVPVAILVPPAPGDRPDTDAAVEAMKAFKAQRAGSGVPREELRAMVEEGRP